MSVPSKEVKPVKEKEEKKRKTITSKCVNTSRDTVIASLKQERGSVIHQKGYEYMSWKSAGFFNENQ